MREQKTLKDENVKKHLFDKWVVNNRKLKMIKKMLI